jgi:hypothetical protein
VAVAMAEHTITKRGKTVLMELDQVVVAVVVLAAQLVEVEMAAGVQLLLNTTHNRENKWQY